ncbi:MAG: gliding motility-associated C-terminal domain-containing protein [Bacteroidales bacterium]|nr:gliding motility-associated C-terminal domain-containing protein [Bacteroidales bacterium]
MIKRLLLLLILIVCCIFLINAQVFNNYGNVTVVSGTSVYVNGSVYNSPTSNFSLDNSTVGSAEILVKDDFINDGTAVGNGKYRVWGDWENNNTFIAGNSSVILEGSYQYIGGVIPTSFFNLTLNGTGPKTQTNNQSVGNVLNLNNLELLTEHYTMLVDNPDVNAIQRTTGFVSSLDLGVLARKTANIGTYLFPVGSVVGSYRYRPVEIEPITADTNIYTVRMANVDATSEGFDRNLIQNNICMTNPLFYHRIMRTAGSTAANISVFYDELNDGVWDGLAHWTLNPQWEIVGGSTITPGTPLSFSSVNNWNDFSESPYILYVENLNLNLGNDTAFCANSSLTLDAGPGFDSYLWSTSDTNQAISVSSSGIYSVTVVKGNCSNSDTIMITVNPVPKINLGNDTTICDGNTFIIDAGPGFADYQWNTFDSTQTVNVSFAGNYSVTVYDSNGCFASDTLTVAFISHDASIDNVGTLCHDDPLVTLNAAEQGGVWSGNGIIDPIAGIFDPVLAGIGVHTITYTISLFCGDTGTVDIEVINCDPYEPHAIVPDIFSPNGDGQNDILFVRGEGILNLDFGVYTRWGEKVFQTTSKDIGWDGTYKGKQLDPGIFVYYLKARLTNNVEVNVKGDLTLVR